MKIRRVLATAVALAVTTPAALLSVSPAYADAKPAAQTQDQQKSKPTIKELEEAAAEAQEAYDKAAKAEAAGRVERDKTLDDLSEVSGTHPLAVASAAADQAAKDAADAKTAADEAVTEAKAALDALTEDATEEERAAAETALSEAEATATTA
ncbi:peptidase, partial [Streptomyces parvus]|nr:peptidase [Streptomyces parvus]